MKDEFKENYIKYKQGIKDIQLNEYQKNTVGEIVNPSKIEFKLLLEAELTNLHLNKFRIDALYFSNDDEELEVKRYVFYNVYGKEFITDEDTFFNYLKEAINATYMNLQWNSLTHWTEDTLVLNKLYEIFKEITEEKRNLREMLNNVK